MLSLWRVIRNPLTTALVLVLCLAGCLALGAIGLAISLGFVFVGPLGMAALGLALLPYALLVTGVLALVIAFIVRVRAQVQLDSTKRLRTIVLPGAAIVSGLLLITAIPTERAAGLLGQRAQCGEPHDRLAVPSPDGRYVASAITWFCGGAAGSIDGSITLGLVNDEVGLETDQIAYIEEGATGIELSWQDASTLVVDMRHRQAFEIPRRLASTWRDIRIVYLGVS